jgi:AcrR family transcriptional regulator
MPDEPSGGLPERSAQSASALPGGLGILWGRRNPGQRGPKPGLSVDAIVEAAIALADEGGLPAVSMANVAKRLGFTTMSLYRYLDSKDELLQLMWNGSAQGAQTLVLSGDGWRARLREWALIQRQMLDRHPWITQMPMAAPPMAPNSLAFVERGLEAMDDTGLTDDEKLRAIALLSSYTLSEARMAHEAQRASAAAAEPGGDTASETASFEQILRLLVDETSYPRLHRIAWEASDEPPDEHAAYVEGVDCILDGVEAMVQRRRRAQGVLPPDPLREPPLT